MAKRDVPLGQQLMFGEDVKPSPMCGAIRTVVITHTKDGMKLATPQKRQYTCTRLPHDDSKHWHVNSSREVVAEWDSSEKRESDFDKLYGIRDESSCSPCRGIGCHICRDEGPARDGEWPPAYPSDNDMHGWPVTDLPWED